LIKAISFFLLALPWVLLSQTNVQGSLTYFGEPFANTTIFLDKKKQQTNADGFFLFTDIAEGNHEIKVKVNDDNILIFSGLLDRDSMYTIDAELAKLELLNPIVITGTRYSRRKLDNAVPVNILDSRSLEITQSSNVADGLCFQPGLRVETDCQTCNYTQLRMNGLGGSYSQILINNRPIFSSLLGLYGLEQIPSSLIDRVEVVRGGGSAVYGSGAIAGVVNIITKKPKSSGILFKHNTMLTNGNRPDFTSSFASTSVNKQQTFGITFMGNHRKRSDFDANGDHFSELSSLTQFGLAANGYYLFDKRNELEFNLSNSSEERQGGEMRPLPPDQLQQSEYRNHKVFMADASFTHYANNKNNWWSTYAAVQNTNRIHYTGIDGDNGWGNTKNYSYQIGMQALRQVGQVKEHTLTAGAEFLKEYTFDEIKGYNYLIDQSIQKFGIYAQSEWSLLRNFTLISGARLNYHNLLDKPILTPRFSAMYKLGKWQRIRASYSQAFKAPQAFETDMHIAFAAGNISRIVIDPNLKQEQSEGINISWDFDKVSKKMIYGFTVNGFYTQLQNAFILEEQGTNTQGNQVLLRKNGAGALVQGISCELRLNYKSKIQVESGFTVQQSKYEEEVSWSENLNATKQFLRTPNTYGFFTLELHPIKKLDIDISSVSTGSMLVPHFGGAPGVPSDALNTSATFFELNLRMAYKVSSAMTFHIGVQNILNAYQKDFDTEKNRDSNYVYGPVRPRSFYAGLKMKI
jgi:outer membrane receptor for ferrienterochelin and colicins